ncbi:MAG: permease [Polyangiaceae bacterium]
MLLGVGIHAVLDGAAMLELGNSPAARALALSVVIHRIPVGLAIWWLVRPRRGLAAALTLLAVEGGGGIVGFLVGGALSTGPLAPHLSLFQAALAGALLHVLAHHAPSPATGPEGGAPHAHVESDDSSFSVDTHEHPARFAAGIGALLAVAFVAFVTREHPIAHPAIDELGASATFFALARTIAFPLLVACAVSGVGHVILPRGTPKWLARSNGALGAMRGLAVGMLLPVCSCGIVPLHRTLADKRLVPSAAAGILVASPELGPAALLLSWVLLGPTLFVARICTAAVAALATAFVLTNIVSTRPKAEPLTPEQDVHAEPSLRESVIHAARFGFVEMLDHTAPWLLAGLLAAALAEPTIPHDAFVGLSPVVIVPAAALLGVPFYVSASAALPLVAVLLHKGLSPGAAVAFLLTAPAVTPATVALLDRRFGTMAARLFAVAAVVVAIGCGLALDQWAMTGPTLTLPAIAPRASDVALALCGLLVATSLLRQGPRAMLGKLLASG